MRRLWLTIVFLAISGQSLANATLIDNTVKETLSYVHDRDLINDSTHRAKVFDMKEVVESYTSTPDQSKYYNGVGQKSTNQLKSDAIKESSNEPGSAISDGIKKHPVYSVNDNEQGIKQSNLILSEAYNITHGMTDQYVDCKAKESCSNTYQTEVCTENPPPINKQCESTLTVNDKPNETVTHYSLIAHLSVGSHNYAGASINAVTGVVSFVGPHDASFRLSGRLPPSLDCKSLQGSIISQKGNAVVDTIDFPSCANNLSLNLHITGGHSVDITLDIASKKVTHNFIDQWEDTCASVASNSSCHLVSDECGSPNEIININGTPVKRDCWEKSFQYICHGGNSEGFCQSLRDQGCEQVNSECIKSNIGDCMEYKQSFRCPIKICSPTTDVICGNGKEYCMNGDCTDQSYQKSHDFGKAVSALSSVSSAGKEIDQTNLKIFTGKPYECSEKPIGFSNCCSEKGWGQDAGLDHCSSAAKELHHARDNSVAIKVGRYCSGSNPLPCLEHSQVYCVFSSKLAKIIQEQGRGKQLRLGFGKAKHPNCEGITVQQLQQIDLSVINFDDFINDVSNNYKSPDLDEIRASIQKNIDQMRGNK